MIAFYSRAFPCRTHYHNTPSANFRRFTTTTMKKIPSLASRACQGGKGVGNFPPPNSGGNFIFPQWAGAIFIAFIVHCPSVRGHCWMEPKKSFKFFIPEKLVRISRVIDSSQWHLYLYLAHGCFSIFFMNFVVVGNGLGSVSLSYI